MHQFGRQSERMTHNVNGPTYSSGMQLFSRQVWCRNSKFID